MGPAKLHERSAVALRRMRLIASSWFNQKYFFMVDLDDKLTIDMFDLWPLILKEVHLFWKVHELFRNLMNYFSNLMNFFEILWTFSKFRWTFFQIHELISNSWSFFIVVNCFFKISAFFSISWTFIFEFVNLFEYMNPFYIGQLFYACSSTFQISSHFSIHSRFLLMFSNKSKSKRSSAATLDLKSIRAEVNC